MFGTEQALLLRRPRCKHQRARRARAGGKGAGDLDQFGDAGGIVDGAIADGVTLRIGHTLPVGIPVRAEQHGLASLRRAGQLAHDVVTGERRRGQPAARAGGSGQRQGAEIGFASGGLGAGQIQARGGQQSLAQPAFDPAGKAESAAKCRRARHHLRHAFGADQLRQRIGGGEILMQHDGAHGAGLGGGCHLDADAASISKAAAFEAQIGPGFTIRIAGEQQHHLAGHIHPGIGIMAARHHAEAGKDHRRGADRHVAGQAQRQRGVLAQSNRQRRAVHLHRQCGAGRAVQADQRHRLQPAALRPGRFQPGGLEAGGEEGQRLRLAHLARPPPGKGV